MPSLKRSETRRRRTRGGADPAERLVREAIAFLFEIKGEEYRKKHPEFITPTVDEFFTYARSISDALESTRVKKGGVRRKLPIRKHSGGSNLAPFLESIVPGPIDVANPCESILRIFNIFLYAVFVYSFVSVFMKEHFSNPGLNGPAILDKVKLTLADPAYINSFADPVRWFSANVVPVLNVLRDGLQEKVAQFVEYLVNTVLSLFMVESVFAGGPKIAWAVGKLTAAAVNLVYASPFILNMLFYIPIICALGKAGFEGCDDVCERLKREAKIDRLLRNR